jgi:hypothetical protein
MHSTSDAIGVVGGVRAPTRSAIVRALRIRSRGCSKEATLREERRAFTRARADLGRSGIGLEDVVAAIRDAWDQVHGPAEPVSGRRLSYYRFVSRCLASCVRPDDAASTGDAGEEAT